MCERKFSKDEQNPYSEHQTFTFTQKILGFSHGNLFRWKQYDYDDFQLIWTTIDVRTQSNFGPQSVAAVILAKIKHELRWCFNISDTHCRHNRLFWCGLTLWYCWQIKTDAHVRAYKRRHYTGKKRRMLCDYTHTQTRHSRQAIYIIIYQQWACCDAREWWLSFLSGPHWKCCFGFWILVPTYGYMSDYHELHILEFYFHWLSLLHIFVAALTRVCTLKNLLLFYKKKKECKCISIEWFNHDEISERFRAVEVELLRHTITISYFGVLKATALSDDEKFGAIK